MKILFPNDYIPGENLMSDISSVLSLVNTIVFNVLESTIIKLPVTKRDEKNDEEKNISKKLKN